MVWDPLNRGGDWSVVPVRPGVIDREAFFKHLKAVDADFTGAITAGRGSITGLFIVGEGPDDDHIEMNGQSILNTLRFFHQGNSDPLLNKDQPGLLQSASSAGGGSLYFTPARDDDEKFPAITLRADGASGGLQLTDSGDTADTHMTNLVTVTPVEDDTIGVLVESQDGSPAVPLVKLQNTFTGTPTAPMLLIDNDGDTGIEVDDGGHDGIWANFVDGANRRVSVEESGASGGLLTDQTNGYLPAQEFSELADLTTITASTWTTVDSGSRPFVLHGTGSNLIRASAVASVNANQQVAGVASCRARIRLSLDGGSTWTNYQPARATVDQAGIDKQNMGPIGGIAGTPTGNVVAELQVWSNSTDTDFTDGTIVLTVFGDI